MALSTFELHSELTHAEAKLAESRASLKQQKRLVAIGIAITGMLADVAEFTPNKTVHAVTALSAMAVGFMTEVGPGLDALQMRFDFIGPERRQVQSLQAQVGEVA